MTFSLDEVTEKSSKKKVDLTKIQQVQTSTLVNNEESLHSSTINYNNEEESKTPRNAKNSAFISGNLPEKVFYSENISTAIPQTRRRRHHRRK